MNVGFNPFRQIDHRSIEYIIYNNVKYYLKKGAKKVAEDEDEEEDKKKDKAKWDVKKLAVGNWFSGTSYFKATKDEG